jgi:hypothetical protein
MDPEPVVDQFQIQDRGRLFARHFVLSIAKNLFTKVILWGTVFTVTGLVYSKLVFSGETMPEIIRTAGTVGVLGVYLAAGLVAGLYFGTLAALRGIKSDLSGAVETIVDKGLVLALPTDRETMSVEEIRRIVDKVAPDKGGLSGLPMRLVRKKVLSEITARSGGAEAHPVSVADIRDYATVKLVGTAVGDIEIKTKMGLLVGYFLVLLFLAGPLVLLLLF